MKVNMSKFILFFIGLSWFFSSMLLANENRFIQYRTIDGLSFNNVDYLAEDDEGYIYASTLLGLNIFDGSSFVIFNQKNTPGFSNKVAGILPIKKGFVLIATLDKGLFLYNKFKEKIIPIRTIVEGQETVNTITAISFDKNNNVWIGCEKGELYCIAFNEIVDSIEKNSLAELTKVIQLKGSIHALSCVEDDVFVGDESSVITRVRQISSKFIVDQPLKIPNSKKSYVFSFYNNNLLIGTDVGLFRYENIDKLDINSTEYLNTPWHLKGKIIRSLSSNENADWVGTEGDGLYKLNRETGRDEVEQFTYSQNKRNSKTGQIMGNLYILHEEPITPQEAIQLDSGYVSLVRKSLEHRSVNIETVAQKVSEELLTAINEIALPTRLEILKQRTEFGIEQLHKQTNLGQKSAKNTNVPNRNTVKKANSSPSSDLELGKKSLVPINTAPSSKSEPGRKAPKINKVPNRNSHSTRAC